MQLLFKLSLILSGVIFFSCSQNDEVVYKKNYKYPINIKESNSWELLNTDTLLLDNSKDKYTYSNLSIVKNPTIQVELVDSGLIFNGVFCRLIEEKGYMLRGNTVFVRAYSYNRKNAVDEESIIFFNDKLGLIAIKSYSWKSFTLFDSNSTNPLLTVMKKDPSSLLTPKELLPPSPPAPIKKRN